MTFSKGVSVKTTDDIFRIMTSEPEIPIKVALTPSVQSKFQKKKCLISNGCYANKMKKFNLYTVSKLKSLNIYSAIFIITRPFPKEILHSCADTSKE